MAASQTLQSAPNGTIWSRRVNGVTYFLRKINNSYEVWTSLASGSRSTVTLDQAVTYYNQYNLVNSNTATAASPAPRVRPAAPPPAPAPATRTRPATPPPAPAASTTPTQAETPVTTPPTTTNPSLPVTIAESESLAVGLSDEELAAFNEGIATIAAETAESIALASIENEIVIDGERPKARADWRVRLALSDDSSVNYLYKAPNPGILKPLNATGGVLFPYTPTISVNYAATYNPTELVHSNYKVFQYSSSSIDSINITCDFTAQDEYEANYLLAVIHFFRSATKMFYGQDENPRRGTPPPLCYIYGMGSYQFAGQPLAISQFSYNLPNNVDYIKTSTSTSSEATSQQNQGRLAGTGAAPGGVVPKSVVNPINDPGEISWVPSKIQLTVTCVPMMNRNAVSNVFSFEEYATGKLLNGIGRRSGGFW